MGDRRHRQAKVAGIMSSKESPGNIVSTWSRLKSARTFCSATLIEGVGYRPFTTVSKTLAWVACVTSSALKSCGVSAGKFASCMAACIVAAYAGASQPGSGRTGSAE